MPNMQSGACIGKNYPEIWQFFLDAHINEPRATESELRAIHNKWVRIASEVNMTSYLPKKYK